MIRIEDLAEVYAGLIGENYFDVQINRSIDYDDPKTQCVLYATRRPFNIVGLDAETIELAFEFYINVENETKMHDMLNAINRINGLLEGSFSSVDKNYTYTSFLSFPRPLTAPATDTGTFMQVVQLAGTVYVSNASTGIKMGNDIKTYLTINEEREEVYVSTGTISNTREVEAPTKLNQTQSSAIVKTQTVGRNLNIYDMRTDFCDNLEKIIEASNGEEINLPITLERVYPTHTVEIDCILTSGTINQNAGAFVTISLNLQKG